MVRGGGRQGVTAGRGCITGELQRRLVVQRGQGSAGLGVIELSEVGPQFAGVRRREDLSMAG